MQELPLALSRVARARPHGDGGRETSRHRAGRLAHRALSAAILRHLGRRRAVPGRCRRPRVDELGRVGSGPLGRCGGADRWDVGHLRHTNEGAGAHIFRRNTAGALLPPLWLCARDAPSHPTYLKVRPRLPERRPALMLWTASSRHRWGLLAIFCWLAGYGRITQNTVCAARLIVFPLTDVLGGVLTWA